MKSKLCFVMLHYVIWSPKEKIIKTVLKNSDIYTACTSETRGSLPDFEQEAEYTLDGF